MNKVEAFTDPQRAPVCDGHSMSGRRAILKIDLKGQVIFLCKECAVEINQMLTKELNDENPVH